jgi:adenylate kinase
MARGGRGKGISCAAGIEAGKKKCVHKKWQVYNKPYQKQRRLQKEAIRSILLNPRTSLKDTV